jgi:hypothetical protein
VLATVKGAALGGLLSLVVVGGLHLATPSALPGAAQDDAYRRVAQRAGADHHCSSARLGDGSMASSALIRTSRGALRQVSFAVGWDVYTHRRPGTLIALCLPGTWGWDPHEVSSQPRRAGPSPGG